MVLKKDGTVWATGRNDVGQLGDNSKTTRRSFVNVFDSDKGVKAKAVAAGQRHSLILDNDGTVWATGANEVGQLGHSSGNQKQFGKVVSGVQAVTAGMTHTLVLKTDGSLWVTGSNEYGQLGDGSQGGKSWAFKEVIDKDQRPKVTAIAAGRYHSIILKDDGSAWTVGRNFYGQRGDGSGRNTKTTFAKVVTDVKAVGAGERYSLIVQNDGSVWGAGRNHKGQLGLGGKYKITDDQKSWVKSVIKSGAGA